jgi:hypothetical protein
MGGLNYRSPTCVMALVIDRSFETLRDAIQGYNCVGRFWDACKRIRFNDVKLIEGIFISSSLMHSPGSLTQLEKKSSLRPPIGLVDVLSLLQNSYQTMKTRKLKVRRLLRRIKHSVRKDYFKLTMLFSSREHYFQTNTSHPVSSCRILLFVAIPAIWIYKSTLVRISSSLRFPSFFGGNSSKSESFIFKYYIIIPKFLHI